VLEREQLRVYIVLIACWECLDFELPAIASHAPSSLGQWIDTSSDSPLDIFPSHEAPVLSDCSYRVVPRSVGPDAQWRQCDSVVDSDEVSYRFVNAGTVNVLASFFGATTFCSFT
jgi:hypothetical protein